jgi:very-long-chain ceramide synthase
MGFGPFYLFVCFVVLYLLLICFYLGQRIMTQLPTYWYQTKYFWIDYPHWDMKPELKRYYLMQTAYWSQQLFVMVLGLERPRKDYNILVAHHIVTIWMVGWSYLINLTLIGNAVYVSMDIPDTLLATSLLFNYLQMAKSKTIAFASLTVVWTYFRHILNLYILHSVWFEFDLIPCVINHHPFVCSPSF